MQGHFINDFSRQAGRLLRRQGRVRSPKATVFGEEILINRQNGDL